MKNAAMMGAWCAWVMASAWFLDGYDAGNDFGPSGLGFAVCVIDLVTFVGILDYMGVRA